MEKPRTCQGWCFRFSRRYDRQPCHHRSSKYTDRRVSSCIFNQWRTLGKVISKVRKRRLCSLFSSVMMRSQTLPPPHHTDPQNTLTKFLHGTVTKGEYPVLVQFPGSIHNGTCAAEDADAIAKDVRCTGKKNNRKKELFYSDTHGAYLIPCKRTWEWLSSTWNKIIMTWCRTEFVIESKKLFMSSNSIRCWLSEKVI